MTTYYKALTASAHGTHTDTDWSGLLPTADGPGPWTDPVDDLRHCESGWHVAVGEAGLLEWLGARVFVAEVDGPDDMVEGGKVPCRRIRLTAETLWDAQRARLFAGDCAARALVLVGDPHPDSIRAVEVARRFAHGEATDDDLSAARDAAWGAARDAAWDAARGAATGAAWGAARDAARGAAWGAARDAAWGAAWGAARGAATGAAWGAERAWQAERLRPYLHDPVLPDPIPLPEVAR